MKGNRQHFFLCSKCVSIFVSHFPIKNISSHLESHQIFDSIEKMRDIIGCVFCVIATPLIIKRTKKDDDKYQNPYLNNLWVYYWIFLFFSFPFSLYIVGWIKINYKKMSSVAGGSGEPMWPLIAGWMNIKISLFFLLLLFFKFDGELSLCCLLFFHHPFIAHIHQSKDYTLSSFSIDFSFVCTPQYIHTGPVRVHNYTEATKGRASWN